MPNHRYTTPEYMRRSSQIAQQVPHRVLSAEPLAMAYVPWQEWKSIVEVQKGLHLGTIFEELYKPFCGIGGCS